MVKGVCSVDDLVVGVQKRGHAQSWWMNAKSNHKAAFKFFHASSAAPCSELFMRRSEVVGCQRNARREAMGLGNRHSAAGGCFATTTDSSV